MVEYLQLEEAGAVAPEVGVFLPFLVKNVEPEQETLGFTGLDLNIRDHGREWSDNRASDSVHLFFVFFAEDFGAGEVFLPGRALINRVVLSVAVEFLPVLYGYSGFEVFRVALFFPCVFVGGDLGFSVLDHPLTDWFFAAALINLHLLIGEFCSRSRIAERRLVHDHVARDIFELAFRAARFGIVILVPVLHIGLVDILVTELYRALNFLSQDEVSIVEPVLID